MTDKPMTEKAIAKAERDLSNLEQQRETLFHRARIIKAAGTRCLCGLELATKRPKTSSRKSIWRMSVPTPTSPAWKRLWWLPDRTSSLRRRPPPVLPIATAPWPCAKR